MEISIPTYNSSNLSYAFRVLQSNHTIKQDLYYEPSKTTVEPPASPETTQAFVSEFLEKSKKYFTSPLTIEKVLRHLRHTVQPAELPSQEAWYSFTWKPALFVIKAGDFALGWTVAHFEQMDAVIPVEFVEPTTPKAEAVKAPEQSANQIRNILIHDSLIPVGDLPLSDLPPLSFGTEEFDPAREETKRRIREARLKVQLARLKAQRMEQKYYERYGQVPEDSEESSDFSSESEEDEVSFGNRSHS